MINRNTWFNAANKLSTKRPPHFRIHGCSVLIIHSFFAFNMIKAANIIAKNAVLSCPFAFRSKTTPPGTPQRPRRCRSILISNGAPRFPRPRPGRPRRRDPAICCTLRAHFRHGIGNFGVLQFADFQKTQKSGLTNRLQHCAASAATSSIIGRRSSSAMPGTVSKSRCGGCGSTTARI